MQVRELMSEHVSSVSPETPVAAAARLLSRGNFGAVPVMASSGRLLGMLTDRDIALRCVAASKPPEQTPVGEVMTRRLVTCSPESDVEEAARLMAREQVRRLPVVADGKLVGLLSLGDLSVNRSLQMEASECLSEICSNLKER